MITTLRTATIEDTDTVTALTRSAYVKWVPVIGREPLPMKPDDEQVRPKAFISDIGSTSRS